MIRPAYQLLVNLAGPLLAVLASFKGRFGGRWRERLGLRFVSPPAWGHPRIWFHGASVGEVRSAAKVIEALWSICPTAEIILTSGTPAGLETASNLFAGRGRAFQVTSSPGHQVSVLAAPLDFWGASARAMARIKPAALVIMETELWPNLIYQAQAAGIPLILAAARLTPRSFNRYRLVRSFMADLLNCFDLIAASGPLEYELYSSLGAPAERIKILGNPKFDGLAEEMKTPEFLDRRAKWEIRFWGGGARSPLITAGSTHPGEEDVILAAFESLRLKHPEARLLLAPRHLNRVEEVLALARSRGLAAEKTGQPGDTPLAPESKVLVLDSLGQLTAVYALSTLVVVGGSLRTGLTGHNPLEPAAVSAPLMFGPNMAGFQREASALTLAGGALETSSDRLAGDLAAWLDDPEAAAAVGRAARRFLAEQPPAAPALAQAVADLLARRGDMPVIPLEMKPTVPASVR